MKRLQLHIGEFRRLRNREPMNAAASTRLSRRSVYDLANELCELFGEQFNALQRGLTEVDLEQYLERRGRIHQLQTHLKGKVSQPS